MTLCVVCNETIDIRTAGWLRQVLGWEQVRTAGGANKIIDRQTTGQAMHIGCHQKSKHHPGQKEMFG